MDSETRRYITVLEHLSYVLECAVLGYMGEGKTELSGLCRRLEQDGGYAIAERRHVARRLREALDGYSNNNERKGAGILSGVSRQVWESLMQRVREG